jgi:hypothetical protein
MEEQVPPSQPVMPSQPPQFTPEQLEQIKMRARDAAVMQTLAQSQPVQQPQIVYVRRNLTVAELIVVFLLSCGIVTGIQWTWTFATTYLPRVEIRVR